MDVKKKGGLLLPNEIFKLLEENVGLHKNLLDLLGKERECLYTCSIEDLLPLSQHKENGVEEINGVEVRLKGMVQQLLRDQGEHHTDFRLMDLIELTNPRQVSVVSNYFAILRALKDDIEQCNIYNRKFIEESLNFIKEALAIFSPTAKSPFYTARGWKIPPSCHARLLNQEV